MKKTIAITCVGSLMGVALLNAVADGPAESASRTRSLYHDSAPWAAASAISDAVSLPSGENAAADETEGGTGELEATTGDVVVAGGVVDAESEETDVILAEDESDESTDSEVTQVQGLYENADRLTRPISTQSPAQTGTSLHQNPGPAQPPGDFIWAQSSTTPTAELQGNPFVRQPAVPAASTAATEMPSPPMTPPAVQVGTPHESSAPSRFTVTHGTSSLPRPQGSGAIAPGVISSSYTSASSSDQSPASDVRIEWRRNGEINVGQETACVLVVKNHGSSDAREIEVTASFPGSVRLLSSNPQPTYSQPGNGGEPQLSWHLTQLAPGAESHFEIALIPLERGELQTQADVRFTSRTSSVFTVSEPLLDVTIDGPQSVLVGEPASHIVTISNPGTGIATHVELEALIPEGLEHSRGSRLLMDLGNLNPGESRSVRLSLAAVRGGQHVVNVQARADASLVDSAASQLTVVAPSLIAAIDGPGLRYLGRQAVYTLSVANDSSVPTDNVRVMHKIPEGFRFVGSDLGAQFDEANSLLNWFVGRLEEGQTAELQVTLEATAAGEFTHFIRATSENGAVCDSQVGTKVEATPSLALELRDIDDPVELGTEAAYEIQVRNEGTAAASNVGLWCELPAGVVFTSASGPSEHSVENGAVHFLPLTQLAPGESATYQVIVNAQVLGNHRLRAHLSSDSIGEPLTDEELTKFYGE